ncbi:MAG: orotidine 5'-phosphate decarboxylase [Staphylothermus sp.]|nr:orotidine 5'-phosphate decarboxylase [Staphylothermus sp.]
MAILQIALDTHDLITATRIATTITSELGCENIWIEAGTPLIKSWGIIGIDVLKKATGCFLVADTKTMDTGDYEAEIVLGAGANAFSILSLASDETIKTGLEQARKMNGLVIVDLINHPNPVERAKEIDKLGVDIILYHIGIDVQKKRGLTIDQLIDEIIELKKVLNAKLAVAGGIKHGRAKPLVDAGADIIVVGGAITKAKDPVESTRRFLEEIT